MSIIFTNTGENATSVMIHHTGVEDIYNPSPYPLPSVASGYF